VRVLDLEVRSRHVDPSHDGVRLAHLSDLHVAAGLRPRRLLRVVERVNLEKPDAVVLTGDFVCTSLLGLKSLALVLGKLRCPAWATLGNHDHWVGAKAVARVLEDAGIGLLCNEHRSVMLRGAPLNLVGIDDEVTGHANPVAAFRGLEQGGTRLALMHDPNTVDRLEGREVALALAGHTHGGQIKLPGVTTRIARRIGVKYLSGFFLVGETVLFVNRGLGAALPIRIAAPMEVAFLTLRAAPASAPASWALAS